MKPPPALSFSVLILFTITTHAARTRRTGNGNGNDPSPGIITVQDTKTIHCTPLPGRISLHACAGAILRLPIDHTVGTFHGGGADDGFRLPVSRTYGGCDVLVGLRGGGPDRDRGSWLDAGRAAAEMNGRCAGSRGAVRRYGSAWVNVGESGRIRIRLRPAGGLRDVDGNGTVVDVVL
ncbi:hypothetical protein HO173_002657 [Letharia columbiana]|uniref:Uncharacterized protein n=1 Tax=Letharia columbiana TaxID=112416 RepID=A0A8H6L8G0_9LECA|nr:uncharacterized protein HO173_002657 [Letharia columbiana]KAF6239395.1 hypothetical protein HO173_002657 [Letharia columbiana]